MPVHHCQGLVSQLTVHLPVLVHILVHLHVSERTVISITSFKKIGDEDQSKELCEPLQSCQHLLVIGELVRETEHLVGVDSKAMKRALWVAPGLGQNTF